METDQDKMFLEVAGMPVVGHTWKQFDRHPDIDETVIVIRDGGREKFEELARFLELKKPYSLVHGGSERQDSVASGIASVSSSCKIVSIQDGARPCTSPSLISKTILAAIESGAAVASSKVTDAIKIADSRNYISQNVDRTSLWAVQTPQVFDLDIIRKALAVVRRRGITITDDTAACELIGQPVVLVPSSDQNPKVTTPEDLVLVELLLRQ
jgi:2-C-methyl-D-erythritol 4-phosphate cytidylyltransferase